MFLFELPSNHRLEEGCGSDGGVELRPTIQQQIVLKISSLIFSLFSPCSPWLIAFRLCL